MSIDISTSNLSAQLHDSPTPAPTADPVPLIALPPHSATSQPGEDDPAESASESRTNNPTGNHPTATGKHRPTGKIARLPKEVRDALNSMLRDGDVSYQAILRKLRATWDTPELRSISDQNLSNWKNAGYQQWLAEQEWREEMQEARDDAIKFPGADDGTRLEHAALKLASMRLFQLFKHLDATAFANLATQKPESFIRLFAMLPRITRESLRVQKYHDAASKARAAVQTLRDPKRKLSEQERRSLVLMVDDLLGLSSEPESGTAASEDLLSTDPPQTQPAESSPEPS